MHVGEMLEVVPVPSSTKETSVLSSSAATAQTPSPSRPESSHSTKLGFDETLSCKHCKEVVRECKRESTTCAPVYWSVRLDTDLLETLIALYPEWFRNCPVSALKAYMMADSLGVGGASINHSQGPMIPLSPPTCEVDESPLKKAMDKNKESLKVKLMMRRPISQLVDQGIMPPLKTPILFHEQQKKLERAKMGDMLKHKIQQRPDRSELVRQHILEDTGKVAPSLAEKQRLLKKAKLADSLNDQLAQRPGPLELIQKNILHTDESVERAVKEGQVPFRPVSEAHAKPPTHPSMYITIDDENSSDFAASPAQIDIPPSPSLSSLSPSSTATPPHQTLFLPISSEFDSSAIAALFPNQVATLVGNKLVVGAVPAPPPTPTFAVQLNVAPPAQKSEPIRDKQKKKILKPKTTMKKTIKFHEYKGPNSNKGGTNGGSNVDSALNNSTTDSNGFGGVETPYELLLQQQQLILQLQIDQRNKMVQPVAPSPSKTPTPSEGSRTPKQSSHSVPSPVSHNPQSAASLIDGSSGGSENKQIKWEDFKVSDLKAELKKRSLPVSGAKPQLIERLKPFWDQIGKFAFVEAKEGSPARNDMIGCPSPAHSRRGSAQAMVEMPTLSPMPFTPSGGKEDHSPVGMLPDYPSSPMSQSCNQRRFSTSSVEGNTFLGSSYSLVSPASAFTLSPTGRPPSVINMDIDFDLDREETLLTPVPMKVHESSRTISIGQEVSRSFPIGQEVRAVPDLRVLTNLAPDTERKPPTPPPLPMEQNQVLNLRDESGSLNLVSIDSSNQVQLTAQEVIRQQQAKIEELLKQLKQQQELMRQQTLQNTELTDPKQQQKLLLQQHIQNRAQTQQLQQQLQQLQSIEQAVFGEPPAPAPAAKPKSKSKKKKPVEEPPKPQPVPAGLKVEIQLDSNGEEQWAKNISVSVDPNPDPVEPVTGIVAPHRSHSLPTFADLMQSTMESGRSPVPKAFEAPVTRASEPRVFEAPSYPHFYIDPPRYQEPKKDYIKSQMVDDVLDILIRNGELPPSAAQVPPTPAPQTELSFTRPPTPPPLPEMPLTQQKRIQFDLLSESEKFDSILKESLNREYRHSERGELKVEPEDFKEEVLFEPKPELNFVYQSDYSDKPKMETSEFGNFEIRPDFQTEFDLKFEIADQKCDVFFGGSAFVCDKPEEPPVYCDPHEPMHFEQSRKTEFDFSEMVDMETSDRMDLSHFDEISPPCTPRDSLMVDDCRTNPPIRSESMDMDVTDWLENIMSTQFAQPLPPHDVQSTVSSSCSSYSGMSSASRYYDNGNSGDPLLSNCSVTLNEMLVDDTDLKYHNSINSINWEKFDFTA